MRTAIRLLSLVFLLGCRTSSKIPEDMDYGKIVNSVYRNDYFGMEVPIPANWVIQNPEEVGKIIDKGIRDIEKSNKEGAARVKEGKATTAMLLLVFKNRPDTTSTTFDPYLVIMAEKLNIASGVKTGRDYLDNTKKAMAQTRRDYEISSAYTMKNVGGKQFDVLEYTRHVIGQPDVKRIYHVRIEREFALTMMICYASPEDEEILMDVLRGTKMR